MAGALVALLAAGVFDGAGGKQAKVDTAITVETDLATDPTTTQPETTTGPRPVAAQFGPGDWGSYGNGLDQTRHSPLVEINRQNVNTLGRAFSIDLRKIDRTIPLGQQSFPIVVDGTIYVTTGADHVFAVDGGSGKVQWHFEPTETVVFRNYGVNANRGVAYCDGKLFLLTLDMRIVAIDPGNGKLVKEVRIADAVPEATSQFGYSETQAPICYDGRLFIGAAGSDFGVRGFFMAYTTDLQPAWSSPYWIIPPELEQWRAGGRYIGGGTNWNPSTIDPTTDTVYITTSNASPLYESAVRPGPNPRTDSVIALDLRTGRQKWWQQQIAGDQWGYSTSQPVLVFSLKIGGALRRVVSVATKEGRWFMYDAKTGAPIHEGVRLLNRIEHPVLKPGVPVRVYPSSLGGLNYSPSSYDPATGFVVNNQAETSALLVKRTNTDEVNKNRIRGDVDNGLENGAFGQTPPGWSDFGSITAVNARTGSIAWKTVVPEPGRGGITTTASGLTFAGGGDGVIRALETRTGHVLWSFQTGYQIASGPSVYAIGGKEYIAITTGGTFTSSYGGTASRLDVFTLGADLEQSPSPAIRPSGALPGLAAESTQFLAATPDPHTLSLQVIASFKNPGGATRLNGLPSSALTFQIPKGWRVKVTFANHSRKNADGIAVVDAAEATSPQKAAFPDAATPGGGADVPAGGVAYFEFTAGREGKYAIASTAPGRAAKGEWVGLEVVPASTLPQLLINGKRYAVNVTGRRG